MSLTRAAAVRAPRPHARAAVVPVAGAVVAGLLLGGCSFTSRDLTLEPYAPSDGLQTDLGEVLVRNVLVVSEGGGEPGVLSGALVNRGEEDATVTVEVAGGSATDVDVAAGETVFLGTSDEGQVVLLEAVEEPPGQVVDVTFTGPDAQSQTIAVPILLPEGAYAELTPPSS